MPILFSILIITFNFTHIHFNPCCPQASIINHISSISATPPSSLNPDIDETSVILFSSCSNFLIIFIWDYTSKLFVTFNYKKNLNTHIYFGFSERYLIYLLSAFSPKSSNLCALPIIFKHISIPLRCHCCVNYCSVSSVSFLPYTHIPSPPYQSGPLSW